MIKSNRFFGRLIYNNHSLILKNMENLRKKIVKIDQKIVKLLGERMKVAKKIGDIKKKAGIPIWDKQKENELRKLHDEAGKKDGLTPKFINKLFDVVFEESRRIQKSEKIE